MSEYKESLKNAFKEGYILDYCGDNERNKYNGLYNDLCGMSVEDYMKATIFPCCSGGNNSGGGEVVEDIINCYYGMINSMEIDSFDYNSLDICEVTDDGANITITNESETPPDTEDENVWEEWVKNNTIIKIIIMPKSYYDNNTLTIGDGVDSNVNEDWVEIKTISIDNEEYSILSEVVENENMIEYGDKKISGYVNDSTYNFEYTLKITL